MQGPSPDDPEPMKGFPQVAYLKNFITRENIHVGDYTYYDDPEGAERFEQNVLYHFPLRRRQTDYRQILRHRHRCEIHHEWRQSQALRVFDVSVPDIRTGLGKAMPAATDFPYKGNTEIGHDVWLGYQATIMPGVKIGSGAEYRTNKAPFPCRVTAS